VFRSIVYSSPDDVSGFGLIDAVEAGKAALTPYLDDKFLTGTTGWSQFGHDDSQPIHRLQRREYRADRAYCHCGQWVPHHRLAQRRRNALSYAAVGTDTFVRAKYYIYAGGKAPRRSNEIPNFRVRVADRFAVSSILQVYNHLDATRKPRIFRRTFALRPMQRRPPFIALDLDPWTSRSSHRIR